MNVQSTLIIVEIQMPNVLIHMEALSVDAEMDTEKMMMRTA